MQTWLQTMFQKHDITYLYYDFILAALTRFFSVITAICKMVLQLFSDFRVFANTIYCLGNSAAV